MKNKLIVAALLLANVISVSAMESNAQSAEASKILIQNGVFKGRATPIVGADLSKTYEGVTPEGMLVQVRFTKEGVLDTSFGNNGVESSRNVGINYNLNERK